MPQAAPAEYPQRKITGSFSSFERRYGPIANDDGSLLVEIGQLPADQPAELVWTVLDCDGSLILSPGYRFVNRFAYVVCEKPWGPSEENNTGYLYA